MEALPPGETESDEMSSPFTEVNRFPYANDIHFACSDCCESGEERTRGCNPGVLSNPTDFH